MSQYFAYCRKSTESEEKQVLSIESQVKELGQLCDKLGIVPTEVFTESKSAKGPGRPIFNDLMKRAYSGGVKGILCWKLDRLARNPIDGSALVWALDQDKITEIVTPHGTFRNNSNDKFLMQIEFGMAKKYVDDLSDNVKRGNRAKLEMGWLPCRPPLGYLNEPKERTIVPDPERFPLIQQMWQLLLQGVRPPAILRRANDDWGLRTRKSRCKGGSPLSRSGLYALLSNPFYYGLIETKAGVFQGKHQPMITEEQFWSAQSILGNQGRPRPKTRKFAYTGMIRCGSCGGMITAEEKVNRHGSHYVYYHCTKKDRKNPCREPYLNARDIEQQISEFLARIHVPERLLQFGLEFLAKAAEEAKDVEKVTRSSLEKALEGTRSQLANLNKMRLRDLLSDEEYLTEKQQMLGEKIRIERALHESSDRHEHATRSAADLLTFANRAVSAFQMGTLEEKRALLANIGSNLTLSGKKLLIEATKPFVILEDGLRSFAGAGGPFEPPQSGFNEGQNNELSATTSQWWAQVDDVRTFFLNDLRYPQG